MKLAIINCHSIVNKCTELEALLHIQNLNLRIGTESYLDETVTSSEVFPSQYTAYRQDRNRHGGGVFILVKSDIPSSLTHVCRSIEQIWVHIQKQHQQSIILGSVCFPPNSPITVLDELQDTISEIRNPILQLNYFLVVTLILQELTGITKHY